jgi:hypothetical protein
MPTGIIDPVSGKPLNLGPILTTALHISPMSAMIMFMII